jgi:hypothetical protein
MTMDSIHSSYSARVDLLGALQAAKDTRLRGGAISVREASTALEAASSSVAPPHVSKELGAFADLAGIFAYLLDWRDGVLDASLDADRHLRAAQSRVALWRSEYGKGLSYAGLERVAGAIEGCHGIDEVTEIASTLSAITLPVAVRQARQGPRIGSREPDEVPRPEKIELEVAFLRFSVDGAAAESTHFMKPGMAHDLTVEVRVSRWPAEATSLVLLPITVEPRQFYEMPTFELSAASMKDSVGHASGRAWLKVPHTLGSRPYEFKYSAQFFPERVEQPVAVVGHRTLRLEAVDLARSPITGYAGIDRRILELRELMRTRLRLSAETISPALTLLSALASISARGLQDQTFKRIASEPDFQAFIRDELRRDSSIGAELQEHPKAGGGISDLWFQGIHIELKFEHESTLNLQDCTRFVNQAQSYAASGGSRLAIVCVLDNSPKANAPFPAEQGLGLFAPPAADSNATLVVVMQGNTTRPSDLSKGKGSGPPGEWIA